MLIEQSELFVRAAQVFSKTGFSGEQYEIVSEALVDITKNDDKMGKYSELVEIDEKVAAILGYELLNSESVSRMSKKEIEEYIFKNLHPQDEIELTKRLTKEAIVNLPKHRDWWSFSPLFHDLVYYTIQNIKE